MYLEGEADTEQVLVVIKEQHFSYCMLDKQEWSNVRSMEVFEKEITS